MHSKRVHRRGRGTGGGLYAHGWSSTPKGRSQKQTERGQDKAPPCLYLLPQEDWNWVCQELTVLERDKLESFGGEAEGLGFGWETRFGI